MPRPLILVIAADSAERTAISRWVAGARQWAGAAVAPGEAIPRIADGAPALALIAAGLQGDASDGLAAMIREHGGKGADVPLVGVGLPHIESPPLDGWIARPDATEPAGALQQWMPRDEAPALARLVASFGSGAIGGLLDGLHAQLSDILSAPSPDDALRHAAHRLAGLAGTLGFASVSAAWRAVSEGDDAAWASARVASRRALHAITSGSAMAPRPDMTGA